MGQMLLDDVVNVALLYLVVINAVTFVCFGIDKYCAIKGKRRIAMKTLLRLAFAGGSVGALLGMYGFRHKTRKPRFSVGIPVMLFVQVMTALALIRVIG